MKTNLSRTNASAGQSLLVIMIIIILMTIVITACLRLTAHRYRSGWRSQLWNECIPVAEAGVEESLMNLNRNGLTNLMAAGWTATNGGAYIDRALSSSNQASYHAYVTGAGNIATNIVTGTIALPAALGGTKVSRTLRIIATNAPLFTKEILTSDGIFINNQTVDCGCNDTPVSGGLLSLNLNAIIGIPNLEMLDICLQATVLNGTNLAMVNANVVAQGIVDANVAANLNVYMTPAEAPFSTAPLPTMNYNYGGTNYTYWATGNVMMNNISLSGTQRMLVTGDTTLFVRGNVDLRNTSYIYVAPGATLRLYVEGATTSIADTAGIFATNALNFQYFGLASNTKVTLNGAATNRALIYAPLAVIDLGTAQVTGGVTVLGINIGGSLRLDFTGAIIGKTVKFNTTTTYHFPTSVTKVGPTRGYVTTSWEEI